jgi:hypothetical protein
MVMTSELLANTTLDSRLMSLWVVGALERTPKYQNLVKLPLCFLLKNLCSAGTLRRLLTFR